MTRILIIRVSIAEIFTDLTVWLGIRKAIERVSTIALVPLIYHSLANGFMTSMNLSKINYVLGVASSISFIIVAVVAVIIAIRRQKNRTLDIPIR